MFCDEFNMSKNYQLHYGDEYYSMPLMEGGYRMIDEYLAALKAVMENAVAQYGRVFAFRFDLHVPDCVDARSDEFSNSVVSRFVESFKAKVRHNRARASKAGSFVHDTKVRYFWVREVGYFGKVHYHFVVLLNGHAFNWLGRYQTSTGNTANRVFEAWASALGVIVECATTLVHFPENPSYMLLRDDQESVAAFFRRASYLCKVATKHHGFGHHGYGASRG